MYIYSRHPSYNPNHIKPQYSFTLLLVFVLLDRVKERLDETDTIGTTKFANNIIWLAVVFDLLC